MTFGRITTKHRARTTVLASLAGGAVVTLASVTLAGQARDVFQPPVNVPGADAVKAFAAAHMAKGFTPPRTPWGDPDLSGIFTTKDEVNTPLERPDAWAGKRMEDITPQEFAVAIAQRQLDAAERAPFAGGGNELIEEGVAIGVPIHWFDNLAAKNSRPWFIIDPPDGKVPALAPRAEDSKSDAPGFLSPNRDTYTDRSLGDRCISFTMWRTPAIYGNSYQIVQSPDDIVFRYEMIHETRMIRLNRPHVSPTIRPPTGDAIGWWEGDTLVVETTNFPGDVNYRGYASKDMSVIERFTRTGPKTVEWSVTVDAPTIWARPWTYSYPMTEDNTQPIHEYACHEGNYGLANILSAGRAADTK